MVPASVAGHGCNAAPRGFLRSQPRLLPFPFYGPAERPPPDLQRAWRGPADQPAVARAAPASHCINLSGKGKQRKSCDFLATWAPPALEIDPRSRECALARACRDRQRRHWGTNGVGV